MCQTIVNSLSVGHLGISPDLSIDVCIDLLSHEVTTLLPHSEPALRMFIITINSVIHSTCS